MLDPGTDVLRPGRSRVRPRVGRILLRLADRLHRAELLKGLQKAAHLDLAPLLAPAERHTARAIQGLFPPGLQGEVRVEPVRILGVGIAGGSVRARCRMAGRISPLAR